MHASVIPASVPGLAHRLWQRLPTGLRRTALTRTTAWLAPAASPAPAPGSPPAGLAIAGEFSRASGLGETARLMADAAARAGLPVWRIDLPPLTGAEADLPAPADAPPPPGVPLVLHVNAPLLPLALLRLPRAIRRRPLVGYWAWEMPRAPAAWRAAARCVNAVWAPSRFTADALAPLTADTVRIVPPPLAAAAPRPAALDRAAFGLPEAALLVLVSCSLAGSPERKNPLAAIAAFRAAFGDRPDRILLLKLTHTRHAPDELARIAMLTAGTRNIRLLTAPLPRADSLALTACADIVLSLHRAEGFGLVLAEAMLLGKPVIATGWSANTEFMPDGEAILIPGHLTAAQDRQRLYDGLWAEPDLDAATAWLTRLADDPALRARIGAAARHGIAQRLTAAPLLAALEALR